MIIASCGHELTEKENLGITILIKSRTKKGNKAVSYINVCNKCFERYKKENLILKTDEDVNKYLGVKP